ncbi:metabolite traffic protein EboE [Pelagibacterium sp. 26DY04]|uniref:metabolite traffic protein EboE n=1 Tax=Pelagibacterium sp. 26DY04 TaxID=2967130 RepID=UPI00281653EB|nr:metabolite traffic protein EboE [Pelagibacterium sp. 26DY04]WMT85503.1 metabolite traffic protein EboE [Pelagibacterium sp. 26DY04]
MKVDGSRLGQLTYCTNIHKGESWQETFDALRRNVPTIHAATAGSKPFGIGLRLSAAAAAELSESAALEAFKRYLTETNTYVFTINGFPYGDFHSVRVKENVYSPDWADPARLDYSNKLAEILAQVLPEGMDGSISTVPGTFAPWAEGRVETITENIVQHVAHLLDVKRRTGKHVTLALEPEPCCMLETIEEAIAFFRDHLYSEAAARSLAQRASLAMDEASAALRAHVGLCYDVCHAAIEFEDPQGSIAALREAGIPIYKLQLSSALRFAFVGQETAELLAPFNEPTYLHQVVGRGGEGLRKWPDLLPALEEIESAAGSEWRVHFHVPVFLEDMGAFGTTQAFLREILALHRQRPISDHLEVETYTWDVLPERYRGEPMDTAIARELNWVLGQLK